MIDRCERWRGSKACDGVTHKFKFERCEEIRREGLMTSAGGGVVVGGSSGYGRGGGVMGLLRREGGGDEGGVVRKSERPGASGGASKASSGYGQSAPSAASSGYGQSAPSAASRGRGVVGNLARAVHAGAATNNAVTHAVYSPISDAALESATLADCVGLLPDFTQALQPKPSGIPQRDRKKQVRVIKETERSYSVPVWRTEVEPVAFGILSPRADQYGDEGGEGGGGEQHVQEEVVKQVLPQAPVSYVPVSVKYPNGEKASATRKRLSQAR